MKYFLLLCLYFCTIHTIAQNTSFNKIYNHDGSHEFAKTIINVSEQDWIFLAQGATSTENNVVLFYKINTYGDVLWKLEYQETGYDYFDGSLLKTKDGNLLAYVTRQDMLTETVGLLILKISLSGSLIWDKKYNLTTFDAAAQATETPNGDFLLTGTCAPSGISEPLQAFALKIDANGNQLWRKDYGGPQTDEKGIKVLPLDNGNYMMAGIKDATSNFTTRNAWLVELDSVGNVVWDKMIGNQLFDGIHDIVQLPDKSFILVGYREDAWSDAWIFKVDSLGNLLWEATYGEFNKTDAFRKVKLLPNGNLAAIAVSSSYYEEFSNTSRIALMTFTPEGENLSMDFYDAGSPYYNIVRDFDLTADGGYIFCGTTHLDGEVSQDAWVMKTDSLGNVCKPANCDSRVTAIEPVLPTNTFSIYPNPTKGLLNIPITVEKGMLTIYDMTGKTLLTKQVQKGNNTIAFEAPTGSYLITLTTHDKVVPQKIVILK